MPRKKASSSLHEPIAAVLGTQAKVSALRILARTPLPLSHREVVRRSGMAYRSIALALADLLRTGVVEEQSGGRERRVQLRAGHRLAPTITALFRAESDFFPALRSELRAIAGNWQGSGLQSASIVGAVATRDEGLGELLEIVLVSADASAANRWNSRFTDAAPAIRARFGVTLRVMSYDLDTVQKLWLTRTAKAESTVMSAETLLGVPMLEVVQAI